MRLRRLLRDVWRDLFRSRFPSLWRDLRPNLFPNLFRSMAEGTVGVAGLAGAIPAACTPELRPEDHTRRMRQHQRRFT